MDARVDHDNSRTLVLETLAGRTVARAVTGPLAVHWCARQAGVAVRDYTLDPRVLADCVARYHERFRPDAVWLSADTWVSAQAMGAAVGFPGPDVPMGGMGPPCVRSAADIDRIPPPDPTAQGRYPLMLEATRLLRRAVGGDVCLVACFDQYPFSLACALMGIEAVMVAIVDDRPRVEALMDRCAEYAISYATALAGAGADVLSGGDSPAGLIGPRLYREVALPFERKVIAGLKSRVTRPVSLHICGNALAIVGDMAASGADVLELDHRVDIARACRAIGPGVAIWGNLDPVGLLARGDPGSVRTAASNLLRLVRDCGHARFVLSSGCTLTMETPAANVHAMLEAVRRDVTGDEGIDRSTEKDSDA
jgi:MtaA/CmuA family methyltransferase